jgi:hypothetical protein
VIQLESLLQQSYLFALSWVGYFSVPYIRAVFRDLSLHHMPQCIKIFWIVFSVHSSSSCKVSL